ncbi:apoptosis regulator Bcl-2-like [Anabas testudineus]|uniref:Apoptosis regulator Bcl-2 family BH4 domain-containing protein n=1 Tax=Anabas testudineus TaxID=64144 RepID=A0A3Q1IMG1_ANATE|nr:apoptosis regulator Bcl-2-like [Anabas testudineus]
MAAAYTSRDMVEDYLRYQLLSTGVVWRTPPPQPQRARTSREGDATTDHAHTGIRLPLPRVQVALRCACDELERRYYDNLSAQVLLLLQCRNRSGVERRQNLTRVSDELFRDGVNWGRIVTMMALGGVLSSEVARIGRVGQVDDIARWLEDSLESPRLQRWIADNGGWDAFVELYGDSRPPGSFWSMRTMFGLAVLGAAGITLGALFSQK